MSISETLSEDLSRVSQEFSSNGEYIGLFGSATSSLAPRDIDVVVRTPDAIAAKKRINSIPLRAPIDRIDVNGYGPGGKTLDSRGDRCFSNNTPGFHFIVITNRNVEDQFIARNPILQRSNRLGFIR